MALPMPTTAIALPALLAWLVLAGTCRGYGQCEYAVTPNYPVPCGFTGPIYPSDLSNAGHVVGW